MKKMNALTILGLILIFIGGFGAILLSIGQYKSSAQDKFDIIKVTKDENTKLKIDIKELKLERISLSQALAERDNELKLQNNEVKRLNEKLVEKSEYIEEFVDGRNRFLYVEMKRILDEKSEKHNVVFSIQNSFEFPIYSIFIQAFDYNKLKAATYIIKKENIPAIKMSDYRESIIFEYKADEIPKGEHRMNLTQYPLEECSLYIKIHTRSKPVIQKFIIFKKGNDMYGGFIVCDLSGTILKEHIYPNATKEIKMEVLSRLNEIPTDIKLAFTQ